MDQLDSKYKDMPVEFLRSFRNGIRCLVTSSKEMSMQDFAFCCALVTELSEEIDSRENFYKSEREQKRKNMLGEKDFDPSAGS